MREFKIRQINYRKAKFAAIFSCAAVFVGGVYFFQPFSLSEDTNATTETTQNGDYYIETTTTDLNLSINTTPAGTQETASHDVIVKTDDPAGFTLTVSVNNDTSNALNLNGSTSATEKFAATSGTYASPKALDDNTWGFADTLTKKNNDQWAAVPLLSNAQQLKQTSSATPSGDTTTVHYGIKAKYDGAHSNGNYSNTIVYSVTGNTIPTMTLKQAAAKAGITTMQGMDGSTVCDDAEIWQSGEEDLTLTDTRDNLSYTIRKLADGHCWMAQNLRLNATSLTNNGHLTTLKASDNDTDLASGEFNMPSNTIWTSTSATVNGAVDASVAPLSKGGSPESDTTKTTARGTYYSWATAVLNTSTSSAGSGIQPNSVCPKGWKLPNVDGSGSSSNTNMYYRLYNSTTEGYSGNYTNFMRAFNTYYNNGASYYLAGAYDPYSSDQYVLGPGAGGNWWSSTAHSSSADVVWYLNASTNSIYPQNFSYRHIGASVRCVL